MKPTEAEIQAELSNLRALAVALPAARRNISVMIEGLESRMTVDQVYDEWDTEDTEFQYALDAANWLAGETKDKPSEGWAD
jgi:hypothetical protein